MFTRCTAQPCWHWLTGGTFDSATGGTFQSDTCGTFHSDTPGTFESDMDGTFKVSQSVYTVHREYRVCVPARNWRRRTRCGLRLGGGSEVVGMVYGKIKTSPSFCRSYYGDVVLVEARRFCYVWCRLETGDRFPATLLCVAPARNWRWKLGVLSCGVPASNSLVNT